MPTSRVGRWAPRRPERRRGLTLVELLVVLGLIVIASGLLLPSFLGVAAQARLDAGARGVLDHCRYARELAVRRQTPTAVRIDPLQRVHYVEILAPEEEDSETLSWQAAPVSVGGPRALPEGVEFEKLGTARDQDDASLIFEADGRAEDWFVSLADTREQRLAVFVRGTTGAAEVLAPEDGERFDRWFGQAENLY